MFERFRSIFSQEKPNLPEPWERDVLVSYQIVKNQLEIAIKDKEKDPSNAPLYAKRVSKRLENLKTEIFERTSVSFFGKSQFVMLNYKVEPGVGYFYFYRANKLFKSGYTAIGSQTSVQIVPSLNSEEIDREDWCLHPRIVDDVARGLISFLPKESKERILSQGNQ